MNYLHIISAYIIVPYWCLTLVPPPRQPVNPTDGGSSLLPLPQLHLSSSPLLSSPSQPPTIFHLHLISIYLCFIIVQLCILSFLYIYYSFSSLALSYRPPEANPLGHSLQPPTSNIPNISSDYGWRLTGDRDLTLFPPRLASTYGQTKGHLTPPGPS